MKCLIVAIILISTQAIAHSGRTNSSGCHNDNKNGGYHCHRSDDSKIKTALSMKKSKNIVFVTKSK